MKFLEVPALSHLSAYLNEIDTGDSIVTGRLEAYTCKTAGSDKKLYKALNRQYELLSKSPDSQSELSISPFGPLSLSTSRRTFISLVCTLNASFPDYDFSSVKPEQFKKEPNLHLVVNYINTALGSVVPDYQSLSGKMWSVLEEEIRIRECDIYSYIEGEADPFSEDGNIWSMNYFFFNKKLRRLVFLTCRCVSKTVGKQSLSEYGGSAMMNEYSDDEDEREWGWSIEDQIAENMDMEV